MTQQDAPASVPLPQPLPPQALRTITDPRTIVMEAAGGPEMLGFVGQPRAVDAMDFGLRMKRPGFNLFAMDVPGTDRRASISEFLARHGRSAPAPEQRLSASQAARYGEAVVREELGAELIEERPRVRGER